MFARLLEAANPRCRGGDQFKIQGGGGEGQQTGPLYRAWTEGGGGGRRPVHDERGGGGGSRGGGAAMMQAASVRCRVGGGGEERGVQMYIVPISCTISMYKTANRTYNYCLCNLSPCAETVHSTCM